MSARARRRGAGLAAIAVLAGLAACERRPPPATPAGAPAAIAPASAAVAAASSAEDAPARVPIGTVEDTPEALMLEAFDDWTSLAPYLMDVPDGDAKHPGTVTVSAKPVLVVELDEDHRALVVTGVPADENGQPVESHATAANIGVYVFEHRDARWFRTVAVDSVTWTGTFGNVGGLKAVEMGAGHPVLTIENGSCWQGYCGTWLELVALDRDGARSLGTQMIASESAGATEHCAAMLEGEPGPDDEVDRCFDVAGHWRVLPTQGAGWADLAIDFTGRELAAGKPGKPPVVRRIDETLVLRHGPKGFVPVKGRNPTHGF